MNELNEIYEVLEIKNKPGLGLTVTDHVFKPGTKFSRAQWKWGQESLDSAIKNKRCKKISVDESVDAPEKSGKLVKKLEKLQEKYSNLDDTESAEAKKILAEIEKIEAEIDGGE